MSSPSPHHLRSYSTSLFKMLCFSPTGKQVFSACHFSLLTADGDEDLALVRTPCWEKQSQYLRLNQSTMLLMSFRFKIKSDARDSSPGEGNESRSQMQFHQLAQSVESWRLYQPRNITHDIIPPSVRANARVCGTQKEC